MASLAGQHWYNSGFVHPPSVSLDVGFGGRLEDVVVLRAGLPIDPTTFQHVMTQVMTWDTENGAIASVDRRMGIPGSGALSATGSIFKADAGSTPCCGSRQ